MVRFINVVLSVINSFLVFMSQLLREIAPASRHLLKWRNTAPMLAFLTGVVGCNLCGGYYQPEVDTCVAFEITSVTGLPGSPVTVKWTPNPNVGPYYIGIGGSRAVGSATAPVGASSATFKIDTAAAAKIYNEGGHFSISVMYPMHNSGSDCTAWKDITIQKPAKKPKPKPTQVPTQVPQQQQQNQPPQPQQPPKPPKPTPCPNGYEGDPSKGESCIKIPT